MKNLVVKVAQIAQVVLSAIFVIMLVCTILGLIPVNVNVDGKVICDSYLKILLLLLSIVYVALSVFLVLNAINNANKLKYVKLAGNQQTISFVNTHIIKKICKKNAKLVKNVKVSKISVYSNELNNLSLNVFMSANTDDVGYATERFRLVLVDSFYNILGIRFSAINFRVKKLKSSYTPNIEEIEKNVVVKKQEEPVENVLVEENETKKEEVVAIDENQSVENEALEVETAEVVEENVVNEALNTEEDVEEVETEVEVSEEDATEQIKEEALVEVKEEVLIEETLFEESAEELDETKKEENI